MRKNGVVVTPEDFIGTDWLERMKRLGFNTLGIHSGGSKAHRILERLGETGTAAFRQPFLDAGIDCEYEIHASAELMLEYRFQKHPEYFAMNEAGERCKGRNWCISNPDVADMITERACKLAKALPSSSHRYYFWGADSSDAHCHCPECRKHVAAELLLRSVNAFSRGIRKADPLGQTAYLAYSGTFDIPRGMEPADGVFLEYAPFHRDYATALNDAASDKNVPYCKAFQELMGLFGAGNTLILEYFLDSSYFSCWRKPAKKPRLYPEILKRDLEFYANSGVAGLTTFAVYMDGEYFRTHGEEDVVTYADLTRQYF